MDSPVPERTAELSIIGVSADAQAEVGVVVQDPKAIRARKAQALRLRLPHARRLMSIILRVLPRRGIRLSSGSLS